MRIFEEVEVGPQTYRHLQPACFHTDQFVLNILRLQSFGRL